MANPFRSVRIFFGELVACLLLGVFTSISDFALYQVVDLFTSWVS